MLPDIIYRNKINRRPCHSLLAVMIGAQVNSSQKWLGHRSILLKNDWGTGQFFSKMAVNPCNIKPKHQTHYSQHCIASTKLIAWKTYPANNLSHTSFLSLPCTNNISSKGNTINNHLGYERCAPHYRWCCPLWVHLSCREKGAAPLGLKENMKYFVH